MGKDAKSDNNCKASNKLLFPEAFAPAITVNGVKFISKFRNDLKPSILM
jgi:hypothetical protein